MLNRSVESGHPCLFLNLEGRLSPWSIMLAGVHCNGFYYVEICSLYTHFDGIFFLILNGYGLLSNAISASIEMIMCFFVFPFVSVLCHIG